MARVTSEIDIPLPEAIIESTRAVGCYIAGVYREKASGARADRSELLHLIADCRWLRLKY